MARATRRTVLIALAASAVDLRASRVRAQSPPTVSTAGGLLSGSVSGNGAHIFRGIPYGASTAEVGRFLPPQPPVAWPGVRSATVFGAAAPQQRVAGGEPQGEDCLVLNVYTPGLDPARRPVIVWLHGGGYASGSGGARYDGSRLAIEHQVVFVAINHRLGVFGFLDLSEFDPRYARSGNVGMLDIVAALRWVRDNIQAFGGDPRNVTVVGQSGGGAKVSTLLAMPEAAGLFHRAIPMSGAVLTALTREQARALTHALLAKLQITRQPLGALQRLPSSTLIDAMLAIGATGNPWSTRLNFGPMVDGAVLPRQTFDPLAPAVSGRVPLLVGSTHDETRLFYIGESGFGALTDAQLHQRLVPTMKSDAASVRELVAAFRRRLPRLSPAELFLEITKQYMFTRNSVLTAERKMRQHLAAAWEYRFDWRSPGPIGARLRASHAVDVPLALDLAGPTPLLDDGAGRAAMAATLSRVWVQFARTGDPNGAGLSAWPSFDPQRRPTMLLDTDCRIVEDPERSMRECWQLMPYFHP